MCKRCVMMAAGPEIAAEYTAACAEASGLILGIEAVYANLVEAVASGASTEELLDLWGSMSARMIYFGVLVDYIDELEAIITTAYAESIADNTVTVEVIEVEFVIDAVLETDSDGNVYVVFDPDGGGLVTPFEDIDFSNPAMSRDGLWVL